MVLPARRDAPVDVVPVDCVADAIFALSQSPEAEDGTFHLTAGEHASSVGELVGLASAFFMRGPPRLIDPSVYRRAVHPLLVRGTRNERHRRTLERSEVFFPYFAMNVAFDDRRSRVALGTGIKSSPLRAYFDRLVEFALLADWGKRQVPRVGATTEAVRSTPSSLAKARSDPIALVAAI